MSRKIFLSFIYQRRLSGIFIINAPCISSILGPISRTMSLDQMLMTCEHFWIIYYLYYAMKIYIDGFKNIHKTMNLPVWWTYLLSNRIAVGKRHLSSPWTRDFIHRPWSASEMTSHWNSVKTCINSMLKRHQ